MLIPNKQCHPDNDIFLFGTSSPLRYRHWNLKNLEKLLDVRMLHHHDRAM